MNNQTLRGSQTFGEADSKPRFDAGDIRFLKDGRISLPYNPKQIIFIGTIEPLKPVKTTNQKSEK